MATLTKKDLLKEYIRKDFYWSNIDKYRKYFDEWYNNLTETQLEFWQKRMEGQIKQEGQKKTIGKSFEVMGMCEIKDLTTEKVDTCLQCSFNITDNDVEVQHLEINIYPGEMDYFNGLMAQIFRV